MKIIDVTLRDGGHAVKFDWDINLAREYFSVIENIDQVSFIELGYWKQTVKSTNYFYNLDQEKVENIIGSNPKKKASVMIDYHYCSKNLKDYPDSNQNAIGMIRVCCRKKDIEEGLVFVEKLKKATGLEVSFNIFNISNYTGKELLGVCEKVSKFNINYVYFADTHGSLDFRQVGETFIEPVKKLKDSGIQVGMHLHDHSGKAFLNFTLLSSIGFTGFDASTRGMGKGVGNLRLEQVVTDENLASIMDFVSKNESIFTMRESPYGMISAKYSITDYYAYHAEKRRLTIQQFEEFCKKVEGQDKDVYNDGLWEIA
jgi:4-hydroxy 2-oxovalerate aldolase